MTWQGIEGGYAGDSSERSTGNSYRAERADRAGQRVGLLVGAGYWADLGRKHCCRDLHGSAGFGDPGIVFSSGLRSKQLRGELTCAEFSFFSCCFFRRLHVQVALLDQ